MKTARMIGCTATLLVVFLVGFARSAEPPRVIRAVPDNGETDVDPGLKVLTVEFDQDMDQRIFSWVGGGENFPKARGRPRWQSARVCIFPVDLEPEHDYGLSINSVDYRNFRSVGGEPAVPYPILFRTGAGGRGDTGLTVEENRRSVEELRRAIDEEYSYRDLRGLDWDALFDEYAPTLEKAETPQEFARRAAELLEPARDIHIWLKVGSGSFPTHRRYVDLNCDLGLLERIVPEWRRRTEMVATGSFGDDVGYILITTWSRDEADGLEPAFEALEDFADTKNLIIDVRPNAGGGEGLAQQFAGCFIDEATEYAKNVYRDVHSPGGFTAPLSRVLYPKKGRPKYRGRVAVLMGVGNMSSCEAFLMMMMQVPDCELIGSRSYGCSGNPKPHGLSNGVTVYLPSWKSMLPDGTEFEGKGIEPDVFVETTPEGFAEKDPVLEAALEILRRGPASTDETNKGRSTD